MKSVFKFSVLFFFMFAACQKEKTTFNQINGLVQKGPFISGTTIMIQELDAGFNPSGRSYSLMTNDDFGSFTLQSEITSEFVEIIATGYYFNEISGRISDGPLTLRAISNLKSDKISNVNILTTLARNRILYLIKNQNKSFGEAKKQSEREILDFFKISMDDINFNELDISKNGMSNAILLAVSAIIQGEHSAGELSEFISKFNLDFEQDGIIQSHDVITKIINNATEIDINLVYANLTKRYSDLSLNVTIPPFELFVKKLCPLMVVQTNPVDNETEVAYDIDAITITFNKSIDHNVSSYVQLKDEQNNSVPIKFAYNPVTYQLSIIPATEFSPDTQYTIILDEQIQATDGDKLDGGYIFSFCTYSIEPEMVYVKGGTFTMGDNNNGFIEHDVTLSSFNIGKYEVTQKQWIGVMGRNPSFFKKGDNYPVEQVSWNDAQKFIAKLNELTGKNYRLPTNAEWEYAARGGNQSKGYKYSGSDNIDEVAWYGEPNLSGSTHLVGTKVSNELGIFDMSGNVLEWCNDYRSIYSAEAQINPTGPLEGSDRVGRGGSWNDSDYNCSITTGPCGFVPDYQWRDFGLRVVLPAE